MNFNGPSMNPTSVSSLRLPVAQPSSRWAHEVDEDDADRAPTIEQRTEIAESYDRLRPATAGLFAGAAGGMLMLATADRLVHDSPNAYDLVHFVGRLVSNGMLIGAPAHVAGFAAAAIVGGLVGIAFARVTHHLRKLAPLLVWSLVFFPAAWTLLHAFVLPTLTPWLANLLPFVPMVAGVGVYAVVVSMQLPLRKGQAPREL